MNEYIGYPVLFLMNLFLIGLLQIMTVCGLITDNLVTYIHLERNSGLYSNSPPRKQYMVTIAKWINNTWVQSGDYSLYWAGNDISSGKLSIRKTFFEGDICHFNFIAGSDSHGYYEYRGVKDSNRNTVSGITEDNGLSFTATSDTNCYVEMMYQRY